MPIGPDSNTVRCRLENLGQPVALIVDDETSAHDALSLILQSDGFAIDQARTGREALDRVRATLPAVVLLDLNLPDIGGIDLIPDIRSMSPDSRIVVVTGFATTTATVLAIKRGAVDILEKPVFAEELLSSVHAAMNFVADSPAPAQHPNRRLKDPRVKKVVSLVEQ